MTDKQKLKSIERKLKLIEQNNKEINFFQAHRKVNEIKRYHELEIERFKLEFHINHCPTCGKKL